MAGAGPPELCVGTQNVLAGTLPGVVKIPYCTLRESKSQFDSALSWRLQKLVRSWLRSVDIVAAGPSQGRAGPRCPEMSYGVISQLRASPQKRDGP